MDWSIYQDHKVCMTQMDTIAPASYSEHKIDYQDGINMTEFRFKIIELRMHIGVRFYKTC